MKARVRMIALPAVLVSGGAMADGNTFLQQCQQSVRAMDDPTPRPTDILGIGRCIGMVEGVMNTMTIFKSSLPDNLQVCFPKNGINNGQAARIVNKFLHDNPKMLDQNVTFLTIVAFRAAYPCK